MNSSLLIVALLAGLLLWWRLTPDAYRYRLTMEVDTPEGLRSGSVVHEIRVKESLIKLVDGNAASVDFAGEALRIDLGEGGAVYALVAPADTTQETLVPIVNEALDPDYRPGGLGNLASVRRIRGGKALTVAKLETSGPAKSHPMLVRFEDEARPDSVELVEPGAFPSVFGEGHELHAIKVERTSDRLTRGIASHLPWLEVGGTPMKGTLSGVPPLGIIDPTKISDTLNYRSFIREYR